VKEENPDRARSGSDRLEVVMQPQTAPLTVEFSPSRQRAQVDPVELRDAVVEFLDLWADEPLVDPVFLKIIGGGDGESRFATLLEAVGFPGDPDGFLAELVARFAEASWQSPPDPVVGGVELPRSLLLEILDRMLPGEDLFDVKRIARLEKLSNCKVPADHREEMQQVLDLYPVRLSSHVVRQMRLSPAVAFQYLPFVEELDPEGLVHTWVGQFHRGVIEQMYRNRVIFVLNMSCPVYCRFCFRKHKECRTQRPPTQRHVSEGIRYIRETPAIKEIVVTGGDPFMNRPTLTWAVDGMINIRHVETLRLATRSLAYHPALFTMRDNWWIDWLERKQLELAHKGKRLEVATHFIHPDEVSRQSLEVISELTSRGVPVYVQTPFLGGCNDTGPELVKLYHLLRGAGAEMHYIFMPCSPLQGNRRYRSSLADGFRAFAHLRAHASDRAVPHLCTATSIGKIDWGGSGWAVEPDDEDPRYLWLRTPYTTEYFESFAPILDLSQIARPNDEGTLDARFWVDAGDDSWLLGSREHHGWSRAAADPSDFTPERTSSALADAQRAAAGSPGPEAPAIVASGSPALSRVHRRRVELDLEFDEAELERALGLIVSDKRITDVIAFTACDITRRLSTVSRIQSRLLEAPHVTGLRLRSRRLAVEPRAYSDGVVGRIGGLNRIQVTRPQRLELELPLLHSSEITDDLSRVVRRLRRRGVTVYAVVPLLAFVNDLEEELLTITSSCRRIGIEVHHLVLAGHPLQQRAWADEHPVSVGRIVDLATFLRRHGSGRELPRLIVQTTLGECDFGLTGVPVRLGDDGSVGFRMLGVDLDDLRDLDPGFELPPGVELDDRGHPVVPVSGMTA
jgi:L-lysine 2,3-aminomutase